jgi:hypothetical protein
MGKANNHRTVWKKTPGKCALVRTRIWEDNIKMYVQTFATKSSKVLETLISSS